MWLRAIMTVVRACADNAARGGGPFSVAKTGVAPPAEASGLQWGTCRVAHGNAIFDFSQNINNRKARKGRPRSRSRAPRSIRSNASMRDLPLSREMAINLQSFGSDEAQ